MMPLEVPPRLSLDASGRGVGRLGEARLCPASASTRAERNPVHLWPVNGDDSIDRYGRGEWRRYVHTLALVHDSPGESSVLVRGDPPDEQGRSHLDITEQAARRASGLASWSALSLGPGGEEMGRSTTQNSGTQRIPAGWDADGAQTNLRSRAGGAAQTAASPSAPDRIRTCDLRFRRPCR
jgi:hypothetical protein